jgi:MarR family transcriptional regulator, temperature-dependent positive regulator of motility
MTETFRMPGFLIRRLHQRSVAMFSEHLDRAGIRLTPVQFAALEAIHATPGLDQATLAADIACDRATIGGVVDRLEARGLVRRQVNPRDRRARQLFLSGSGDALYSAAFPVVNALQNRILHGIADSDRKTFVKMLHDACAPEPTEGDPGPTSGL